MVLLCIALVVEGERVWNAPLCEDLMGLQGLAFLWHLDGSADIVVVAVDLLV